MMNGADVIAEILKQEGTEFLSCYPRNPVIEACAELGIRPILCRQERVGVGIADGYTRVKRGKINGVFAAQQGPGIENAFAGVAQAFAENVPMLILPGGSALARQYRHPVFDSVDVFGPVTKWAARAHHVSEIPGLMRQAYHAMRTGRGGPVLFEIPAEVWEQEFEGEIDYTPVEPLPLAAEREAVSRAADALLTAENPVIWAGQGVLYADATDELVALAEMLPAPVMTTNPGKSAFPENHALSLGASTRSRPRQLVEMMKRCDVLFAIGSSLTKTPFGPMVPPGKRIIHSTNDASDINKDYQAELGVLGDSKLVLQALIDAIAEKRGKSPADGALQNLTQEIAGIRDAWLADWNDQLTSDETPINQYRVIQDMMDTVDKDNVIITHDSGSPREQLLPFWQATQPLSYLGWGKSTQLGYGLGLNMGAKLAAPDKLCINVMGDAAIGMTGMDLETAARNGIGSLTIVFNNGVMAAERDVLVTSTEKYGALTVSGNYSLVAQGLNVGATRVEQPDDFIPALKKAMKITAEGKPYLIESVVKEGYDFARDALPGL
jgi:acetolactate synthase-1/2/3 large subunit